MVEQTVWWALRDPLINPEALLVRSGIAGSLPSPLAVTPPSAAWAPRHLDWEVEVFPTRGRAGRLAPRRPRLHPRPPRRPRRRTRHRHRRQRPGPAHRRGRPAGRPGRAGRHRAGHRRRRRPSATTATSSSPPRSAGAPATCRPERAGAGTQTIAQAFVAALRNMDVMAATLDGVHARAAGRADRPVGRHRPAAGAAARPRRPRAHRRRAAARAPAAGRHLRAGRRPARLGTWPAGRRRRRAHLAAGDRDRPRRAWSPSPPLRRPGPAAVPLRRRPPPTRSPGAGGHRRDGPARVRVPAARSS